MCLEGGCGACIVNVSGVKTPPGNYQTFAVNSVRRTERSTIFDDYFNYYLTITILHSQILFCSVCGPYMRAMV